MKTCINCKHRKIVEHGFDTCVLGNYAIDEIYEAQTCESFAQIELIAEIQLLAETQNRLIAEIQRLIKERK